MSCKEFRTPLVFVANKTDNWVITTRWSAIDSCIVSKILWPYCLWERTLNIMSADKVSIRLSLGTVWTMNLYQYLFICILFSMCFHFGFFSWVCKKNKRLSPKVYVYGSMIITSFLFVMTISAFKRKNRKINLKKKVF